MKLVEYLKTLPAEIDFDLVSDEEEHDMATIVENPLFLWTDKFQEDFKDVLQSEIVKFIPASKVNTMTFIVNGVPAKRIEEFQFIMAGYCPEAVWDLYHTKEIE